jgi:hypothetical protein
MAFSFTYYKHDLNLNHDLINYISILPYYNIRADKGSIPRPPTSGLYI